MTNYVTNFSTAAARVVLGCALAAGLAPEAQAQTQTTSSSRFFVDVQGAVQVGNDTLDTETTFPVYGETAVLATRHDIGNAKAFNIRLGYRYRPRYGAAFAISGTDTKYDGSVGASIPDPVFVNRPRGATAAVEGLVRREFGYHLQFLYFVPRKGGKVEITLGAGPSFIRVEQPVILVAVPTGTQQITVGFGKNKDIVPSVNASVDITYAITQRIGAGVFGRFTGGSSDFDDIANVSTRSGQIGAGLRYNF